MAELIQALTSTDFPKSRPQKRMREKPADDFSRWLSRTATANANAEEAHLTDFPVPPMSSEGILILAQAHTEEFGVATEAYEHAAEIPTENEEQYVFEFVDGALEDEEI